MKLLPKAEAKLKIQKENDDLIEQNLRLRKQLKDVLSRLNLNRNLDDEKAKVLRDFEIFIKEINQKKSKLLGELRAISTEIERQKDIYYGFIEKQDALEEKAYTLGQKESQLELRESFVRTVEKNINDTLH